MTVAAQPAKPRYRAVGIRELDAIGRRFAIPRERLRTMHAVARVFPFRTNEYVLERLIDWHAVPDDPIYQLTFPQRGMLAGDELEALLALADRGTERDLEGLAARIQDGLNPHPGGQLDLNAARDDGVVIGGLQHKYRETVLVFPSAGQTCHAYCAYCFRWPQFVGRRELRMAAPDSRALVSYLRRHPEVTNVLFTGGDPLVMRAERLARYVEPLLDPSLGSLETLRIGTKALVYWPYRFTTDPDADDLLRLFARVARAGRQLAVMLHVSHPRELETPEAEAALGRVRATGAVVYCQAPLARHVNDDASVLLELWRRQLLLGCVPYYLFVQRDTGPRRYFEVPLLDAYELFRAAYARLGGLGRTVRGPVMSATPGKVVVDGTALVGGGPAFVLRFLQARDPDWVGVPFFARADPHAVWFDELVPAAGDGWFFLRERSGCDA